MVPALVGCSSHAASGPDCAPMPAADVNSSEGWLGRISKEPNGIAIAVDDGRGHTVGRRIDDQQPIASAVKVVPLAAYARAVAAGTLDPHERIPVGEWERWAFPGTDGGAHEQARSRLPGDTVTLDEMVSAMIRESDNAVPDYLRDRLGDRALIDAAEAGGWHEYQPSSKLGDAIRLLDPQVVDVWAAARRYAADPAYRAAMRSKSMPSLEIQASWADTTPTASARQLASMHRSIATGSFGAGSDIARAHLEWRPAPDGFVAMGFKGGAYPGVLADAIYLRRADGTVATAVLLERRMPEKAWESALTSFSSQELLVRAVAEPDMLRRLTCAV
ncbi:class A beta-lactamase-related serine hydrolase [Nocardia sp. CDC159]|uniref:Class A beta-lactamase-related serine hydrolase n=1 Tax=Nocardia pulmonis TaxID=2951408 RepID=A0A9X2E1U6_9NOCA|nr:MULTISPECIES: serine hydrolase [Nocardia]MCM6772309.1 class A beta-lactamase-related serine hydrolase [Nocardia pulmonis]MCM6785033.1 class A beta-lactamase-related serine hydrolase [Nocardia sp. CDC159]